MLGVQELERAMFVPAHRSEVGSAVGAESGLGELRGITPEGAGGLLGDEAGEARRPGGGGRLDDNDAGAEPFARGPATGELREVKGGHGLATIVEQAGEGGRGLGQGLQREVGEDGEGVTGVQRVAGAVQLENKAEHGSGGFELEAGYAGLQAAGGVVELLDGEVRVPQGFGGLPGGFA